MMTIARMDPILSSLWQKRLGELNEEQRDAVILRENATILAGAGSGKTTVLSLCVVGDILDGVDPQSILVSTFTRTAAAELRLRIAKELDGLGLDQDLSYLLWLGTIDAINWRFLRENALESDLAFDNQLLTSRDQALLEEQVYLSALKELDEDTFRALASWQDPLEARTKESLLKLIEHKKRYKTLIFPKVAENLDQTRDELIDELNSLIASYENVPEWILNWSESLKNSDESIFLSKSPTSRGGSRDLLGEAKEMLPALVSWASGELLRKRKPLDRAIEKFADELFIKEEQIKKERGQSSFLDLSLETRRLLKAGVASPFKRVYLDEAQDTDPLQWEILSLFSPTLTSVGDSAQSIYRFRGAESKRLRDRLDHTSSHHLTLNYRSEAKLLEGINSLVEPLPLLAEDKLSMRAGRSPSKNTNMSFLWSVQKSAQAEAEAVLGKIDSVRKSLDLSWGDVAILCSSNEDASTYADVLRKENIPVLLLGKQGLLKREECKSLISYLHLLHNPTNSGALFEVLSSGLSGLRISEIIDFNWKSPWDNLKILDPKFCLNFLNHQKIDDSPSVILERVISDFSYDLYLEAKDPSGGKRRNLERLLALIREGEHSVGVNKRDILNWLELPGEDPIDCSLPDDSAAQVMTFHQAKGREFPLVVLARLGKRPVYDRGPLWLSKGLVGLSVRGKGDPVSRDLQEQAKEAALAELQRLFYVGATRAQVGLILVSSTSPASSSLGATIASLHNIICPEIDQVEVCTLGESEIVVESFDTKEVVHTLPDFKDHIELEELPNLIPLAHCQPWQSFSTHFEIDDEVGVHLPTGSREFGTKMHAALEKVNWQEDAPLGKIGDRFSNDEKERALKMLNFLEATPLRARLREAQIIGVEREFYFALMGVWRGQVDLIAADSKSTFIIDWKTGELSHDYSLQEATYLLALALDKNIKTDIETFWVDLAAGEIIHNLYKYSDRDRWIAEKKKLLVSPSNLPNLD